MNRPILIVSDSPDCPSGLARIGRDLARKLHQEGATVGYCGYWGRGKGTEPYPVFAAGEDPTTNLWPIPILANGFFSEHGGSGVVLTLYDPMWMAPLGLPGILQDGADVKATIVSDWAKQRRSRAIELWGSFPIDAHCPSGKLPSLACEGLKDWDRVAGWTNYGAEVLTKSLKSREAYRVLPLGLHDTWTRARPLRAREIRPPGWGSGPVLGVVATNQQRKDWGLVFQAFASLPKEWHLWAHVNRMLDYWNLTQLVEEYELEGRVTFSHAAHDHQLAAMYAACTVTFAPGKGEGFGFPILESQLAGTPCVAIDYAGGAELTLNKVSPLWLKPEGPCSFLRPTVWPHDLTQRLQGPMATGGEPEQWLWENVWPAWETWMKEGDVL